MKKKKEISTWKFAGCLLRSNTCGWTVKLGNFIIRWYNNKATENHYVGISFEWVTNKNFKLIGS